MYPANNPAAAQPSAARTMNNLDGQRVESAAAPDCGGREIYKHETHVSYEPSDEHKRYDHGNAAHKMSDYPHETSYENHYADQQQR